MGLEDILMKNSDEDIHVCGMEFSSEEAVCSADGIENLST